MRELEEVGRTVRVDATPVKRKDCPKGATHYAVLLRDVGLSSWTKDAPAPVAFDRKGVLEAPYPEKWDWAFLSDYEEDKDIVEVIWYA